MFTEYDVVVLIILLTSAMLALFRGFIREVFSFVAWVGAAVITFMFYPLAAGLFKDVLKSSVVVSILAVMVTYFVVFFLLSGINAIILDFTREVRMGPIDRALGLVFGVFRGLLIVSLIHYSIVLVQGKAPKWLEDSEFYKLSASGASMIEGSISKYVEGSKERFGIHLPEDERAVQEKLDRMQEEDRPDHDSDVPERIEGMKTKLNKTMKSFTPDE